MKIPLPPAVIVGSSIVIAAFMTPFGFVLATFGYHTRQRGSLLFTARDGATQIISATTHPKAFWIASTGALSTGILLLFIAGLFLMLAIYALFRIWRVRPLGAVLMILGFAFIIGLALLLRYGLP